MNDFDEVLDRVAIAAIVLVFGIAVVFGSRMIANKTTEKKWNNGICPTDNISYELKAVSGEARTKYYVCPECKTEVKRWEY